MKNLLTALKELGKKMTNQDITGTNLVTVVDDIANKYTGGGGGGEGGSSGPLVVEVTTTTTTDGVTDALDKTWQEIHDAVLTKGVTIIRHDVGDSEFIHLMILSDVDYDADSGEYAVSASDLMYTTSTADGYPMVGK